MRKVNIAYTCDKSGDHANGANRDLETPEGYDANLPADWLEVRITRWEPNEQHVSDSDLTERASDLVEAQIGNSATDEQKAEAIARTAEELANAIPYGNAPVVLREAYAHIAKKYASAFLKMLDVKFSDVEEG